MELRDRGQACQADRGFRRLTPGRGCRRAALEIASLHAVEQSEAATAPPLTPQCPTGRDLPTPSSKRPTPIPGPVQGATRSSTCPPRPACGPPSSPLCATMISTGPRRPLAMQRKGRKERATPLPKETVTVLKSWTIGRGGEPDDPLSPTRRGTPPSRAAEPPKRPSRRRVLAGPACTAEAPDRAASRRLPWPAMALRARPSSTTRPRTVAKTLGAPWVREAVRLGGGRY
jgi:hypothetical protein